ncbi:hypothetical protein C6P45_002412 [Maudiozyma exigua]|uniref:Fork-head domain-containing protein n=1 Tax=Maudiozyma exigua TaxID=34358 RepID=A0A9P6VX58_MAUEX|nr:hypothetical protein C6P45_002412 [Kazachstania exigua]
MEVDSTTFNMSSPIAVTNMKSTMNDSLSFDSNDDTIITPPNSTVRKSKQQLIRKLDDGPLSPIQSSPIAPTAKRQRSEGCPRSNGNLSLTEVLLSLEKRQKNDELDKKPPYSYAILICLAILQSKDGRLTLSQIYQWISTHFTFYKLKDSSWQNSIRHNLSLNEAFIKTQKSSDGKGHFWEVKPLSMPKFFKGDTEGYDIIRQRIANIGQYFQNGDQMDPVDNDSSSDSSIASSPSPVVNSTSSMTIMTAPSIVFTATDEDDDNMQNKTPNKNQFNIHTPVKGNSNNTTTNNKIAYQDITRASMTGTVFGNEIMKRTHTTLGLESTSETIFTAAPREYLSFNEYSGNNNGNHSAKTIMSSPQNSKRYICSFNSSFDELSPRPFKNVEAVTNNNATAGLLGPFSNSSIPPSNSDKFTQLLPLTAQNNISNIETEQLNLLKTPELKRSQSLERSPSRFMATPKDTDAILKKWQTPSHLFEDIYSSPIFKAMGNSSKVSATPGGSTLLKKFSPSKINSESNNEPIKSKLACGGLFGVDVYSVWQRATERSSSIDENTLDTTLEHPFNAKKDSKS